MNYKAITFRVFLNYSIRILFVVAGVLCILKAPKITSWFPYLIGSLMILTGFAISSFAFVGYKKENEERSYSISRITRGLLILTLGIVTICKKSDAMPFIGVAWGLLGLLKGERGISIVLSGSIKDIHNIFILIESAVEIVLSFILLFNPVDSIGNHIILLGVQIIIFGLFKIELEHDPAHIFKKFGKHISKGEEKESE